MLKYNEDYLWEEYGIQCIDEEELIYTVPVVKVDTIDEYYEDAHGIREVELPKLEEWCMVEILINDKHRRLDIVSFIDGEASEGVAYTDNINWYHYSDDGRYYATHYIAEQIRKAGYENVLVQFIFFYNQEELDKYIYAIEYMD